MCVYKYLLIYIYTYKSTRQIRITYIILYVYINEYYTATEPCISAKEAYISAKEASISACEPCISAKEPYIHK